MFTFVSSVFQYNLHVCYCGKCNACDFSYSIKSRLCYMLFDKFSFLFLFGQFEGSTPSACWNKIFKKIRKTHHNSSDGFSAEGGLERSYGSGSDMFGFSNPEVMKLLQV